MGACSQIGSDLLAARSCRVELDHAGIDPRALRDDVFDYATAGLSKSAAIHPVGTNFTVSRVRNARETKQTSLGLCNQDATRQGQTVPCFLQATGNSVVLSQRLTGPVLPATVR